MIAWLPRDYNMIDLDCIVHMNSYHMCSSFNLCTTLRFFVSLNDKTEFELLSDILIWLLLSSTTVAILQKFYVAAAA